MGWERLEEVRWIFMKAGSFGQTGDWLIILSVSSSPINFGVISETCTSEGYLWKEARLSHLAHIWAPECSSCQPGDSRGRGAEKNRFGCGRDSWMGSSGVSLQRVTEQVQRKLVSFNRVLGSDWWTWSWICWLQGPFECNDLSFVTWRLIPPKDGCMVVTKGRRWSATILRSAVAFSDAQLVPRNMSHTSHHHHHQHPDLFTHGRLDPWFHVGPVWPAALARLLRGVTCCSSELLFCVSWLSGYLG